MIQHYKLARRFWRLCHELRTPATDKRQGFSHSKAKKPSLDVHTQLHHRGDQRHSITWRVTIPAKRTKQSRSPLLDFLLSVLTTTTAQKWRKLHSDGILAVAPPPSLLRRLKAYWLISWQYAELDDLRKGNQAEQQRYLQTLRGMGFDINWSRTAYWQGSVSTST